MPRTNRHFLRACKGSDHANAMNEKKMPQVLPHYSGLEAVF